MATPSQLTTHELWIDGRSVTISLQKLTPTSLRISWTAPTAPKAYDGAIILLSEERFSATNFPVDGTRYTASSNWAAPADTIDHAHVVASYYGFFGDSLAQTSVDISNVDPDKLYYASIHVASNVLQYYPLGVQSYPLESSRFEKQSDTYAGSIPQAVVPPSNPTNGQVYFDPTINRAYVWNADALTWLETNNATVPTGLNPLVSPQQIHFNTLTSTLKVFTSGMWVTANAVNTRVKFGAVWVPLGLTEHGGNLPVSPFAGDIYALQLKAPMASNSETVLKVFTLGQWLTLTPGLMQFETSPAVWENIKIGETPYGSVDPAVPVVGDFFYNSSAKDLLVWDGDNWTKADTENEGTPTSDKINIGTDGSYDERLRLMNILKGQMGYPKVCVELGEEQFNIAIDNALDEFRRRADNAYTHRHVMFTLKRGQTSYYLNDPRNDSDKIVNVLKIHRVNMLGVSQMSTDSNVFAQAFYNQFYQGGMFDLVSMHLMHQLSESYERIFAGNLVFNWDEASRQLLILRNVQHEEERVVIEVVMERTEQELMVDRWAKQWIQGWAHAEAKQMLGMIRSKYGNLPGPNGGITLNGDLLLSEAETDFQELLRQITDYEVGNGGVNFGNASFLIG